MSDDLLKNGRCSDSIFSLYWFVVLHTNTAFISLHCSSIQRSHSVCMDLISQFFSHVTFTDCQCLSKQLFSFLQAMHHSQLRFDEVSLFIRSNQFHMKNKTKILSYSFLSSYFTFFLCFCEICEHKKQEIFCGIKCTLIVTSFKGQSITVLNEFDPIQGDAYLHPLHPQNGQHP